jgi:23S rRNA pseudouridine2604 synthase
MDNEKVRLSKLMAERGLCSRREADELIARGWVKVDGLIIDQLGSKVERSAKVELHPQAQSNLRASVTILLNKPIGYVSGQPEKDYLPAVRLITPDTQFAPKNLSLRTTLKLDRQHFEGLAPAGRLDIDSQGLLVFTQNGSVAKQLIGENSEVEKEYLVRVQGSLTPQQLKLLNHGLSLDGVALKPAKVEWLNEDQLKFILREGKKRQIRRMCELVGLRVIGLKRVRIGQVMLGDLPEGSWRFLAPEEKF